MSFTNNTIVTQWSYDTCWGLFPIKYDFTRINEIPHKEVGMEVGMKSNLFLCFT